ncbi:MAG: TonB-dependent receptor [Archangium sp.]|nr:TonB-dependent receptor [Archangium sp.]MDP3154732.1 TonB-dependent receptor [Archangium sp.]MDP3573622.1 TonB-dependent receptor [Archangium sp.]
MFTSVVCLIALATTPVDGGVLALPPVDVALPPVVNEPLPTSPVVRDPSATLTIRDATNARAEAKDASELLTTTPGAVVQDSGGAGQRKTLSLRGAAPNAVLVLLDGVPLAGPGAAMDLSRIPVSALERIEVLRGGGSARYGPGAMGGVVNLVTRSPDGSTRLFADVTQGSFVTTQLSAGGATSLLGGDGLVLLHGLRSEGTYAFSYDELPSLPGNPLTTLTRTNNGALQGGGLIRFRRRIGATQVDLLGEGSVESRGLAGPVQNPSDSASQLTGRGTFSARTTTRFEAGGSLSTLGWGRLDDTTLNGTFFGAGTYHQRETSLGAEAVYSRLFAGRHGVTALISGGGDWLTAANGVNPSWGRFAAMLGDEELFFDGALSLSASARVDVAGRFVVFSPKVGVVAELPRGFSVRANAGQASRPPAFTELYVMQGTLLPNPDLRPERALTGDVGAAWKHERGHVSATGFLSLYEDLISYEYYPPNLARPYNFQAARVAGLELEAAATPWRWLELTASYTFLDTQNQKDDPRYYLKALPFRPAHRLHARVSGGPDWLKGRVEVLFQTAQFTNRTETLSLPARAFVNVGLTARPWKDPLVTVSVELKNLLDVQTQDLDGYPLPPRAVFVTVGVAWDARVTAPQNTLAVR